MEGPEPIRVLVVDDHRVVREGLRSYLELVDDIEMVGDAADGRAALDALARAKAEGGLPDVVLMDLMMEPMDGIAATAAIKERYPEVEVVAVTSFIEEEKVHAALEAGAAGYLLKDAEADEVAVAIRAARRGEVHLDPAVARRLTASLRRGPATSPKDLPTDRERENPAAGRAGQAEQGDRGRAGDQRADGADTREQHPRQARPDLAHPGGLVGGARGSGAPTGVSRSYVARWTGRCADARMAVRRLTVSMSSDRPKPACGAGRRVLIVDDDPRVRAALGQLVQASEGVELAATAGSTLHALAADTTFAAPVVLVDVMLPTADEGLALIHALAERGRRVVATSVSSATRKRALAAGAARFVEKGPDPQALLSALR